MAAKNNPGTIVYENNRLTMCVYAGSGLDDRSRESSGKKFDENKMYKPANGELTVPAVLNLSHMGFFLIRL